MLKWLWNVVVGCGCEHKWKVIHHSDVYEFTSSKMPYGRVYHLQCEKCGWIRMKKG